MLALNLKKIMRKDLISGKKLAVIEACLTGISTFHQKLTILKRFHENFIGQ